MEGSGRHACNCPPPPEGVVRPDDHGHQMHHHPCGRVDAEGRPFLTTVRNEPPHRCNQQYNGPRLFQQAGTTCGKWLNKWQATYGS